MQRACSPCAAPGFFFFVLMLMCSPLRKLCFFLFLVHGVAALISGLVACACNANMCAFSACNGKRVTSAVKKEPLPAARTATEEVSAAAGAASAAQDLSSVNITSGEKTVSVHICAPGLRTEDLDMTIVQNVMRVKGESRRGATTFGIDRRIELPTDADGDTATATHADGVVTVTMDTKAGTRVRIVTCGDVEDRATDEAPSKIEVHDDQDVSRRKKASASSDDEHDEWETLPAPTPAMMRKSAGEKVGDERPKTE